MRLACGDSFPPQNLCAALGGFAYEISHFGVRRFDVGGEAVLVKSFGGHWADRSNQHARKSSAQRLFLIHFGGDLQQVIDLHGRRE